MFPGFRRDPDAFGPDHPTHAFGGMGRMVLGLLVAGCVLGAAAAVGWLLTGGSLLLALAIYSLVATTFILATAAAVFWLGARRPRDSRPPKTLRPAE